MIPLAGVLSGAILFLAFRRFTDRAAVRAWKRKRRAEMLGLYLFGDDPLISLRSFAQIARANAALLWHALPALAMAAPLVCAAAIYLDRSVTGASVAAGHAGVATAYWSGACEPQLETPAWLRVDSPPVHVPQTDEVSWRVRATEGSGARLRAGCGGQWASAEIASEEPAGPWLAWFGAIAWATSWLLGLGERLMRFLA